MAPKSSFEVGNVKFALALALALALCKSLRFDGSAMVFSSYMYVEQKALLLEAKGNKAPMTAMLLCEPR